MALLPPPAMKPWHRLVLASMLLMAMHSPCSQARRPDRFQTRGDERQLVTSPCTTRTAVWVASPTNCSVYFVCSFGRPVAAMACPSPLLWSAAVNNCVRKGSRFDYCSDAAGSTEEEATLRRQQHHRHQQQQQQQPYPEDVGRGDEHSQPSGGDTGESFGQDRSHGDDSLEQSRARIGNSLEQSRRSADVSGDNRQAGALEGTENGEGRAKGQDRVSSSASLQRTSKRRGDGSRGVGGWSRTSWRRVTSASRQRTRHRGRQRPGEQRRRQRLSDSGRTSRSRNSARRRWGRFDEGGRNRGFIHRRRNSVRNGFPPRNRDHLGTTVRVQRPPMFDRSVFPTTGLPRWRWPHPGFTTPAYRHRSPDHSGDHSRSSEQHSPKGATDPVYSWRTRLGRNRVTNLQRGRPTTPTFGLQSIDGRSGNGDSAISDKDVTDWLRRSPWWRSLGPVVSVTLPTTPTPAPTPGPRVVSRAVLPWPTPSHEWVPETWSNHTRLYPTSTPPTPPVVTTTTPTSTTPQTATTTTTLWSTVPASTAGPSDGDNPWSGRGKERRRDSVNGRSGEGGGTRERAIWTQRTSTGTPGPSQAGNATTAWSSSPGTSTPRYVPECGVAVTNLIVGGLPASEGSWPWVVSLRLTWAQRHVCGGTLVHQQWIVTAAHCVYGLQFEDASQWRAVFGNRQPVVTSAASQQHKVDLILRHPEFVNGGNYPNDVALLRLDSAVDVTGFAIRHACLPPRARPFTHDSQCWIMGWGETKGLESQSVLHQLSVKIRRNRACAAMWGWKRILNSHVCVGNGDGGACNGDSGGPLICRRDGYHYLVGVTSWGVSGCQTTGYPSVFSRASFYEAWIDSVIHNYSKPHAL